MTARSVPMRRSLSDYPDQVTRKAAFLAAHPDVTITTDRTVPPSERWRGRVPSYAEVTSHELGLLLDRLDDLMAARDAHVRWPNWTFTRRLGGWQAQGTDDSEPAAGRTLEQVEAQIAGREHPYPGRCTEPFPTCLYSVNCAK